MKKENIDKHNQCQCEIRWRQFKNKSELTPGLFCQRHDVFLDWLKIEHANVLISLGTSQAPYSERKHTKPKKSTPQYVKWVRNQRTKRKMQRRGVKLKEQLKQPI